MRYITTTKNLFDKSIFSPVDDVPNATLIDVKENGWIVQGNSGSSPGYSYYSNGWFRPGATHYDSDNIGMLLPKAGKITVSAYYTVLENNSIDIAAIYLNGKKAKESTIGMLPDVGIKTRLYTTFDINDGEEGIYYPVFTLNSSKILIEDIQVEYGETPTDYVPYGYLPMSKGRYKVSDVCQLLDKSKYPATQTINGVTFTNNGDGTITVNGTATKETNLLFGLDIPYPKNHITLLIGCPIDGNGNTYYLVTSYGNDYGKGLIKKQNRDIRNGNCYITVTANTVVSNIIFKPQLFDLTEMYGAGNEPTTVEEFKQKYPNELYPYSPYCWVKMKQMRYITTTKNLFDMPLTQGYPSDTNYYPSTKRTFTIGTYIVGMTRNNYYEPRYITNVNISKNSISFKTAESGWGISVPFLLTVGNTYTVSCKADNNFYPGIGITYYKEDGTLISFTESQIITNNPVKSFTVPENTYYTLILCYGRAGNEYTFSNIQLEEGSTATPYVPYGYLPLK